MEVSEIVPLTERAAVLRAEAQDVVALATWYRDVSTPDPLIGADLGVGLVRLACLVGVAKAMPPNTSGRCESAK